MEHPQVGLVDHISILPLAKHNSHPLLTWKEWQTETKSNLPEMNDTLLPNGWVARTIGHALQPLVRVLWYGRAHTKGKSLASVRREQEQRMRTQNRVWDDVDQRWVEAKPNPAAAAPGGVVGKPKAKVVGVKIDGSGAIGKSANVQAAVNKRVNDLKESQAKALQKVRDVEAKKKRDEEEEDIVRRKLEPKIKAWSEEHGKKKQIRALLATLHTILWPGTKWKQVSIGDLLDDSKVKRSFHKATLVVHPDKTHDLPVEQRFLAKRIFDALCQAKTEFDNGAK